MEDDHNDWEFMLDGNHHVLRNLAGYRGTQYMSIYGGVDHYLDCPNDDFRMSTWYARGKSDANIVWQIGYELIGMFNGASELYEMNAPKLSLHRLLHKGREVSRVPPAGIAALLGKPPYSEFRIAEEFDNARKVSNRLTLLHLATENQDVYFILKYLNMEAGWVTYYKLLEVLEEFGRMKGVDLNIKKSARRSFENTANNFSLVGFDARHGFERVVKENKTPVMSLSDAHAFVTLTARTYLQKVHAYTRPLPAADGQLHSAMTFVTE